MFVPNAIGLTSSLRSGGRIVGPAIGGVLIAAVGLGWVYAINAITFVPVVAALLLLAFAFARPFFAPSAAALSAGATVVLIDTSVSLSAPGQFERARALAHELLIAACADDGGSGQPLCPFADGQHYRDCDAMTAILVARLASAERAALERAADLLLLRTPKQSAQLYALARVKAKANPQPPIEELRPGRWLSAKEGLAQALSTLLYYIFLLTGFRRRD